jgi:D-serine deaminase-like pyridoxal phosphate-dependent protein
MLNGSQNTAVDVDDYIFLRPNQRESVMLQFGDRVVFRDGDIIDRWPVFFKG